MRLLVVSCGAVDYIRDSSVATHMFCWATPRRAYCVYPEWTVRRWSSLFFRTWCDGIEDVKVECECRDVKVVSVDDVICSGDFAELLALRRIGDDMCLVVDMGVGMEGDRCRGGGEDNDLEKVEGYILLPVLCSWSQIRKPDRRGFWKVSIGGHLVDV